MFAVLLANRFDLWRLDLWYAVPIVAAISLVYAATRHEQIGPIFLHAGRVALWIAGFMAAIFAVIQLISWRVG